LSQLQLTIHLHLSGVFESKWRDRRGRHYFNNYFKNKRNIEQIINWILALNTNKIEKN
jgi:hypothetical protein